MDDTAQLRCAIEALSANSYCRQYPTELRARIVAHAERQLQTGRTTWEIARSLGMAGKTLQLFMNEHKPTALVPVRVVDDRQVRRARQELVIRTPAGLSVEGLELSDVVTLLRALA